MFILNVMKKIFLLVIVLLFFQSGFIYANDYRWDIINALLQNDLLTFHEIIRKNINTMTDPEKRLLMNLAINYSSGENTLRACELLLNYNIRPTAFDLYTAIDRDRQNGTINLLLQNGAVPNGEILLLTMERQRFDFARQFIISGVDVNYSYPLESSYADGMTSLLYASKWDNFDTVKLLIENGANINARAINGDTALSLAQKNNNISITSYLLERGATDIQERNDTPAQNMGIAELMDNQNSNFQTGSYRLSGNNRYILFTGNSISGTLNYVDVLNAASSSNGVYTVNGNNLTIMINGHSIIYRIDSGESFSGNGEVWIKTGG